MNNELIHDLRHGYPSALRLQAADALEALQGEVAQSKRLELALKQAHVETLFERDAAQSQENERCALKAEGYDNGPNVAAGIRALLGATP